MKVKFSKKCRFALGGTDVRSFAEGDECEVSSADAAYIEKSELGKVVKEKPGAGRETKEDKKSKKEDK